MDAARSELERIAAPKQANSDAAALVGYLAAFGVIVQPDAINRILVLLAVLVMECGGGLALAVGPGPSFLVMAVRVRTEQYAARFQRVIRRLNGTTG